MSEIVCLRCKANIDEKLDACPACGDKVTSFQRTYATKLIDGKYQILERLGLGGMGEIFKVRHIHLNEQRVIKIMRANIASDEQALQRFLHEARLATMIKHRNLAMLYDFSTLDDGSYYMVWEYIEGTNIQKWIAANGPVPPRLALEIAIQGLAGLEALHQMGIIHRDISPENIMLSQDYQGRLLVKVIDFGIAKQLSEGEGGHGLTQTGMFLGKLKYASPEQAGVLREGEQLDARSDLYSFGIVFYEMLAGKAPFIATNPHGYILKHATEKPQPISVTNPNVTIPPELEAMVLRTLEKDRDVRFDSTGDFIEHLEAIRSDVAPDEKYGIGERMMTLTGRGAYVETRTTKGARTPTTGTRVPSRTTPATKPAPQLPQDSDAQPTQMTAPSQMPTGNQPTVADRALTGATPTVVDRLTGPTIITKPGLQPVPGAEPTVLTRPSPLSVPTPPERSRAPLYAIAAVILLAIIGTTVYFMIPKGHVDTKGGTSGQVTDTGKNGGIADVNTGGSASDGWILLTNPSGQLERIENIDTRQPVTLADGDREVPLRLKLPAGKYRLTVTNDGLASTFDVTVQAGQNIPYHADFKRNLDEAVEDVFRQ